MEQKFREILGLNIKIERTKKRLTQEALAELINISTKHLTKIENAHVTPSSFLLYSIANVLNITIDRLVSEDNSK